MTDDTILSRYTTDQNTRPSKQSFEKCFDDLVLAGRLGTFSEGSVCSNNQQTSIPKATETPLKPKFQRNLSPPNVIAKKVTHGSYLSTYLLLFAKDVLVKIDLEVHYFFSNEII